MRILKYRGSSVSDVLSRIKDEHGTNVVVLSTKEAEDRTIEVRIGLGAEEQSLAAAPSGLQAVVEVESPLARAHSGMVELDEPLRPSAADTSIGIFNALGAHGLRREYIEGLRSLCQPALSGGESIDRLAGDALSRLLQFESRLPLKQRIVCLLGATGVGKTTTIAKLAARLRQACGLRIGLISLDHFRIGAGFQLQTYASLMRMPCRVLDPEQDAAAELRRALQALSGSDLILIDSLGLSPRDKDKLAWLRGVFAGLPDVEHMLALPASGNDRDLMSAIRAFREFEVERVILTKLDESGFIGPALNSIAASEKKLAFFTTGQRVPEDIEPASARRLGWMMTRVVH